MCEVMEKYQAEAVAEAIAETVKEGRIEAIKNMMELGLGKEQILQKYSKEEYEIAKKTICVQA